MSVALRERLGPFVRCGTLPRQEVAGDPPREAAVWETFLTNCSVFERIGDEEQIV
jgi:hypothetical protein